MSSVATVHTRPQKGPSKARKPYMKPLIEERERKPYSKPGIDERTHVKFEERVAECERVIDYRIDKKISEAKTVGLDYDELRQAALEGVLKAMISHDPKLGRFPTWAGHKIRGEITKMINQAYAFRGSHNRYIWITRGYEEALRIYRSEQYGFPRTNVAVAVLDDLKTGKKTEDQVEEERIEAKVKLNRRNGCFLEDRISTRLNDSGESLTVMNQVESKMAEDWEEPDFEMNYLRGTVWEALDILNEREKYLIIRRYLEGEATLQELGDEWGVSRERARQIESKAFRKLREVLGSDPLVCSNIYPELL